MGRSREIEIQASNMTVTLPVVIRWATAIHSYMAGRPVAAPRRKVSKSHHVLRPNRIVL